MQQCLVSRGYIARKQWTCPLWWTWDKDQSEPRYHRTSHWTHLSDRDLAEQLRKRPPNGSSTPRTSGRGGGLGTEDSARFTEACSELHMTKVCRLNPLSIRVSTAGDCSAHVDGASFNWLRLSDKGQQDEKFKNIFHNRSTHALRFYIYWTTVNVPPKLHKHVTLLKLNHTRIQRFN